MFSLTRILKTAALALAGAIAAVWPTGNDMAQAARAAQTQAIKYPWTGTDDEIVVNLAIGSLRDSMIQWLTTERGVHAETLLVSIGAVAGFAVNCAVQERIRNRDIPGATKGMPGPELGKLLHERGLAVSTTKSGETYFFGDLFNGYLVHQSTTLDYHLFGILGAAAVEAGVRQDQLPDVLQMFRRAAQTVGTPDYGILNPPKPLDPQFTPREALTKFWPQVKFIFERTDGQGVVGPAKGRSVKPEYWPLVSALVARQFLLMAKDTIDPRVAMALIMESAIVMSKIDPASVPHQIADKS